MSGPRRSWIEFRGDNGESERPIRAQETSVAAVNTSRERRNALQRDRRARQRGAARMEVPVGDGRAPATVNADEARERRNALQRERRARQRDLARLEANVQEDDDVAARNVARERKNALQRERRARLREAMAGVGNRRAGEIEIDQRERLERQRNACRAKATASRADDKRYGEELSARILEAKDLVDDEIRWLANKQHFLLDPRLALVYYYCCGTDPRSFIFGDEQIGGDGGEETEARISELLEDYPRAKEIAACQQLVKDHASESTSIWACAACGRIILNTKSEKVFFSSLRELRDKVMLSSSELQDIYQDANDAFVRKYRQLLFHRGEVFFLIPELVRDHEMIPLCQKCNGDPRNNKFSVAAGHDYGRIGNLPALNDVASSCISPARCFGLELSLSGKHSSGHAICFPTNGPCELARVLPNVGNARARVTFIGPRETWRIQKKKFLKLFDVPVDEVYEWLNALASVNNIFKEEGIHIEDSPRFRALLGNIRSNIESEICIVDTEVVNTLDDEASASFDERSEETSADASVSSGDLVMRSSVVLPQVEQSGSDVVHGIIDAMVNAVAGETDAQCQDTVVIPVKQARYPFVEWVNNAKILASVFPNLFLTGSGPLPAGSLPRDYVDHFLHYWDGRFEKSVTFTAMLFNQMQRHAAVRKAASVGDTHGKAMQKFGELINTSKFKDALASAKANPESKEASRLNAGLLRLLSLVGGSVPFSPFERAATRPKLAAMRFRYGIALHWVTVAPPEHDDLLLHRIAHLRSVGVWNDCHGKVSSNSCRFGDLPEQIQNDARSRLRVSALYPALAAQVFERRIKLLTDFIIRRSASSEKRTSSNYLETECGVYGRCAAFNAVIEPQKDGRLHAHMTIYGSSINPSLLARIAACDVLTPKTGQYIDAVSCTKTTAETRSWVDAWKEAHGRMPRAFEITVPDAMSDYEGFLKAAEKQVFVSNIHSHSATCRKGIRGRSICRLSRPAGIHEGHTRPLCIRLLKASVLGKRQRALFSVDPVCGGVAGVLNSRRDYTNKRVVRDRVDGAIVWEQHRPAADALLVETNLPLACLTSSHTNSAIMNGEDAGDMVEEYQQQYMTKEKGGLKCATTVMHAALTDILRYPSTADDSGSCLRQAKHLATRTVNAFSGGNEWSHSLMAYALAGHRSYLSSDTFWYVFPHALATHCSQLQIRIDNEENQMEVYSDKLQNANTIAGSIDGDESSDDIHPEITTIHDDIDNIVDCASEESAGVGGRAAKWANTGARMYRIDGGEMILLTQAMSYQHRGKFFQDFTPLEFEMIVDLLPRSEQSEHDPSQRGRPKRRGFDLDNGHPLAPHFQGFIRTKFKTPMLGGAPPPPLKKNGQPSVPLSRYLLCLLTPWARDGHSPPSDLSPQALLRLCKSWDSVSATFINRQRYQYIYNMLQKQNRSSKNEKTCSEWRRRNADFWGAQIPRPPPPMDHDDGPVADTVGYSPGEFYELTIAAAAKNKATIAAVQCLRGDFWSIIPDGVLQPVAVASRHDPIFRGHLDDGICLSSLNRSIHTMRTLPDITGDGTDGVTTSSSNGTPPDLLRGSVTDETERMRCSPDQRIVFDRIFQSMDNSGGLKQTLTLLHGGGGTGKSALVRRIASTLARHGIKTVNTCPTGVGASHLQRGQTFHSAFKTMKSALSVNDLETCG